MPRIAFALVVFALILTVAPLSAATLVVANKSDATVSLVDLEKGEVRATLPTGEGPHEVAVSPNGRQAIVTNYGVRGAPGASLTILDVPQARVVSTIELGEHRRPHGVEWLDDDRAAVTAEGSKSLLVVNVTAGKIEHAVSTGQEISHMLAVTPKGDRAFVANIGSGSVTVVDLDKGVKITDIQTGEGAEGVDVEPDGTRVWVTNRGAENVTVLDAATLEVVATVECASFPIRARVTPDGANVLVSNARSGDIAVLDTSRLEVSRRVELALEATETEGRLFGQQFGESSVPIGVVVEPSGRRAWVAHSNADAISVLDLTTWKKVGSLSAGREPDGMAYSPLSVRAAQE